MFRHDVGSVKEHISGITTTTTADHEYIEQTQPVTTQLHNHVVRPKNTDSMNVMNFNRGACSGNNIMHSQRESHSQYLQIDGSRQRVE